MSRFPPNFLVESRYWPWRRINILKDVSEGDISGAQNDASRHQREVLPCLRFTEHKPEWVLLYRHIKKGQIRPEDIRHVYRADLEYIAGMNSSPPGLKENESAKLRENVARASMELQRRNIMRAGVVGAFVGAVATIISVMIKNKVL